MKKVICFGEILWDNLPSGRLAGGAPMNVAYHLRKLGIDSSMLSRVGNDVAGKDLQNFIASIGIPTNLVQLDQVQSTSEVIAELKANNEMSYTIVYPTAWDFITWENNYAQELSDTDAFLFGSLASRHETSRNTLFQLLEYAKFSIFDVNLRAPHYKQSLIGDLLKKANIVKLNENEIVVLGKWFTNFSEEQDQVKSLLDQFDIAEIVVTKGAQGSTYYNQDTHIHQSAVKVNVVDTVGSGDSFLAGFISKKLAGEKIEDCLNFASTLGAFITTYAGACPAYQVSDLIEFKKRLS
ncbi:5-dehydro-2-deoxygluconokinase [compost metagenome]